MRFHVGCLIKVCVGVGFETFRVKDFDFGIVSL